MNKFGKGLTLLRIGRTMSDLLLFYDNPICFPLDIYNVELILSGVMKQDLEWNLYLFFVSNYGVIVGIVNVF